MRREPSSVDAWRETEKTAENYFGQTRFGLLSSAVPWRRQDTGAGEQPYFKSPRQLAMRCTEVLHSKGKKDGLCCVGYNEIS